jgi:hypothetical protein
VVASVKEHRLTPRWCWLSCIILIGCGEKARITDHYAQFTCRSLTELACYVVALHTEGGHPEECQSVVELLERCQKSGLITDVERDDESLVRDSWRRPFIIRNVVRDNLVDVRVISSGRNGILEDGGGDDIMVEIELRGAGGDRVFLIVDGKREFVKGPYLLKREQREDKGKGQVTPLTQASGNQEPR